MVYKELKETLAAYAHRDDLDEQIIRAIRNAETRIYGDLKCDEMSRWVEVEVSDEVFNLPYDFISARAVVVYIDGKSTPLDYLNPTQYYQRRAQLSGPPAVYTVAGGDIHVYPPASEEARYSVEITYYAKPAALTNDVDTNALLNAYPNIFIGAGMLEVVPFTENHDDMPIWREYYQAEVVRINGRSASTFMGGTAPMMRAG